MTLCKKKNPLSSISIGIAIFLLLIISTNLFCGSLGLIICTNNYFTFYIFILTKVILVNSTISFILLTFTPSKHWYNVIGMSILLPVFIIPSSFLYYFYIQPVLINSKLALIDIIEIRLANIEQSWYEFKLAILYKVDDIKIILTHLKAKVSCLKLLFF